MVEFSLSSRWTSRQLSLVCPTTPTVFSGETVDFQFTSLTGSNHACCEESDDNGDGSIKVDDEVNDDAGDEGEDSDGDDKAGISL